MNKRSPLAVNFDDVEEIALVAAKNLLGGSIGAKVVFGQESSLMLATRYPGYHSKPHRHNCEQLNYVIDGEGWLFVERSGIPFRRGDVTRIPRNAVHWAWIRGDKPCTVLEVHTPNLLGDDRVSVGAVPLLEDGESMMHNAVGTEWVEVDFVREVELAFVGESSLTV